MASLSASLSTSLSSAASTCSAATVTWTRAVTPLLLLRRTAAAAPLARPAATRTLSSSTTTLLRRAMASTPPQRNAQPTGPPTPTAPPTSNSPPALPRSAVVEDALAARVTFFGERHHEPAILREQLRLLSGLAGALRETTATTPPPLTLVLEMFHLGQQPLLDAFNAGRADLAEVEQAYARSGEGFAVEHYSQLLVAARALGVPVQGGFVAREVAQLAYKQDLSAAIDRACALYGLPRDFFVPGSAAHYARFHQLVAGPDAPVSDRYRRLFDAQVLKDSAMAWRIRATLAAARSPDARVLAICGTGHVDFRFGVPERVAPPYSAFVITAREQGDDADEDGIADCILAFTPEPLDPTATVGPPRDDDPHPM